MAQNFVGSNNVNLLLPNGQFGTRLMGGKDAASARYIYTALNKVTRTLYHPDDDVILGQQEEEGQMIEPKHYLPILPVVLMNGAEGIGTGWSTHIPCFSPREIAENFKNKIKGEDFVSMVPFYKGYQGSFELIEGQQRYLNRGAWELQADDDSLEITELPIGKWTKDFKTDLEKLIEAGEIDDVLENHPMNRISFKLVFTQNQTRQWQNKSEEKVEEKLKLRRTVPFSNMVLYSKDDKLYKYQSEIDIMNEFYTMRLQLYKDRKAYLLKKIDQDYQRLSNKARFVMEVVEERLTIMKVKKKDLMKTLKE